MQQGIKKLQWFEYLKVVFLEILNPLLFRVFANQVTIDEMSLNLVRVSMDYKFMPNFIKIRRGQDFFADLAWNDPYSDQLQA